MIAPESIDLASLPTLALSERKRLPNVAACYLVLEGEKVLYIGQSKNLAFRWNTNHKKLKYLMAKGSDIKIA